VLITINTPLCLARRPCGLPRSAGQNSSAGRQYVPPAPFTVAKRPNSGSYCASVVQSSNVRFGICLKSTVLGVNTVISQGGPGCLQPGRRSRGKSPLVAARRGLRATRCQTAIPIATRHIQLAPENHPVTSCERPVASGAGRGVRGVGYVKRIAGVPLKSRFGYLARRRCA